MIQTYLTTCVSNNSSTHQVACDLTVPSVVAMDSLRLCLLMPAVRLQCTV